MSNFLENYGKALFVLVLISILIAFASPLGIKIKEYTLARVDNIKKTSDDLIAGKPKVDSNEPKEVTDIYAILYTDGELVLSRNEIKPKKEIEKQFNKINQKAYPWAGNYDATLSKKITTVTILDEIKPSTCNNMFFNCVNLKTLNNFENFYTSNVLSFNGMFDNCSSLSNIASIKNWNVSNGTDFNYMFKGCESLYDATCLNNWNISDSATKTDMFANTKVTTFPSWYK